MQRWSSGSQSWRRLCPMGHQNSRLISRYWQIKNVDRYSPVWWCKSVFFFITLSCLMSSAAFIICLLGTVTCYSHLSHELVRDVSNTLLAGRWNQPSALNLFLRNWSFTLPLTVTLGYGSARRASGAQSTCGGYMRCPGWTVGYMFWICLNIY